MTMASADPRRGPDHERDDELIILAAAGEHHVGDFNCVECGYGIVSRRTLPACPICHGAVWEESSWRRFSGAGTR